MVLPLELRSSRKADLELIRMASRQYEVTFVHPGHWALSYAACQFAGQFVRSVRPQTVMEFGSGFSTLVIAQELERQQSGRLDSIDHLNEYSTSAEAAIQKAGLSNRVNFHITGLGVRVYDGWPCVFYRIPATFYREPYDLVLVDGPPHTIGRDGALPEVWPHLRTGGFVILDDCNSEHMKRTLRRWQSRFENVMALHLYRDIGQGINVIEKTSNVPVFPTIRPTQWAKEWLRTLRNLYRIRSVGESRSCGWPTNTHSF